MMAFEPHRSPKIDPTGQLSAGAIFKEDLNMKTLRKSLLWPGVTRWPLYPAPPIFPFGNGFIAKGAIDDKKPTTQPMVNDYGARKPTRI